MWQVVITIWDNIFKNMHCTYATQLIKKSMKLLSKLKNDRKWHAARTEKRGTP
jgi:hypothetical protein